MWVMVFLIFDECITEGDKIIRTTHVINFVKGMVNVINGPCFGKERIERKKMMLFLSIGE